MLLLLSIVDINLKLKLCEEFSLLRHNVAWYASWAFLEEMPKILLRPMGIRAAEPAEPLPANEVPLRP